MSTKGNGNGLRPLVARDHKDDPAVSVVMPVYNGEPYLREAVESILNQTFKDFEFIIIDDGSEDDTWRILTEYAAQDERLALRRNPENLGLIKTLNVGLALARGKYIARQDADDLSLPERLEKQVDYLERHPDVGVLGTAYYRRNGDGKYLLRQPPLEDTEIRWRLLFDNIWPHPSLIFRRRLFGQGESFYKEYLHAEDYELWVRLLTRARAATLAVPLVVIRTHTDQGISATNSRAQEQMVAAISAEQIGSLMRHRPLAPPEIAALQRCYHLKDLTRADMAAGGRMFHLFKAFEGQPGADPAIVHRLRRRWVKRVFSAIPVSRWRDLWASGLLASIFRHDAAAAIAALLTQPPKRAARQMKQAFRNRGGLPHPLK